MITTNDDAFAEMARSIKDFGRESGSLLFRREGINAKMTEFQALLGILELARLPKRLSRRWYLSGVYEQLLRNTPFEVVDALAEDACSSYYKLIVKIPGARALLDRYCRTCGVELTGEVYRIPLHRQPIFKQDGVFPIADYFCSHHVCPPLYPELSVDEVMYVCDVLKGAQFYDRAC